MKNQLGFILFCIGVIVAILGGAKAPAEGANWPDTWWLFAIGVAIAGAGLVMWHKATTASAKEEALANSASGADPISLLKNMAAPLEALQGDIETLDANGINERVDAILTNYVLPLAEVRQQLVNELGMERGAEALVTIAYAERMLNRVWTAAADGHLPEARACYPDAVSAFNEAVACVSTDA